MSLQVRSQGIDLDTQPFRPPHPGAEADGLQSQPRFVGRYLYICGSPIRLTRKGSKWKSESTSTLLAQPSGINIGMQIKNQIAVEQDMASNEQCAQEVIVHDGD